MDEVTTTIASAIEEQGAATGEISNNSQQAGFVTLTGRTRKDPCQLFFKPPRSHFPRRRMRRSATA